MRRHPNVGLGILGGLFFAVCYSIIALVLYVGRGGSAVEEHGVSLGVLILAYFIGGVAGGALVGLLWPLTVSRIGFIGVSIIGALPMCLGMSFLVENPFATGDFTSLVGGAILAVILGAWAGVVFWSPADRAPSTTENPDVSDST